MSIQAQDSGQSPGGFLQWVERVGNKIPNPFLSELLQKVGAQREVKEVIERLATSDHFQVVGCPFP